jgi:regulator of replication initiation timing
MSKDLERRLEEITSWAKSSMESATQASTLEQEIQLLRVENRRLEAENSTLRKLMARDFKLVRKEYPFENSR